MPDVPIVEVIHSPLAVALVDPEPLRLLDVGIVVFNADNAKAQFNGVITTQVFDEIKQTESKYLPFQLRTTLVNSNQWGAVRVLPETDPSVDLLVQADVLGSNGQSLQLHVKATDSSGKQWLNAIYSDKTEPIDYPDSLLFSDAEPDSIIDTSDPFQDLYNQIANDLLATRNTLAAEQLHNIANVSLFQYANDLSPETFSRYLQTDAEGLLATTSLPASDDPMVARINDMRNRHYLFIDSVDNYYSALYEEMQAAYGLWRQYSYEQIIENETTANADYDRRVYGRSGNFTALTQRYNRYMWAKIYAQEFAALAAGFNYELAPAVLELNNRVHGVTGTIENQYSQWREILRQLYELEMQTLPTAAQP